MVRIKKTSLIVLTLISILMFSSSCVNQQRYERVRNYTPQIQTGKTTKQQVLQNMGRPNGSGSGDGYSSQLWSGCNQDYWWYLPVVGWLWWVVNPLECYSVSVQYNEKGVVTNVSEGSSGTY